MKWQEESSVPDGGRSASGHEYPAGLGRVPHEEQQY